jgi:hypothetical protein
MKTKLLITLLWAFIAVAFIACTTTSPHTPHTTAIKALMQNPKTAADYEAVASHYEEDAKIYKEKEEEHKNILSQYEREPWLFGKQEAIGFDVHCKNLIRIYSQAAEENLEMAKMYKQRAAEIKH